MPPARDLEKGLATKLQLYEQADKDSMKFRRFFKDVTADKPFSPFTDTAFPWNRQSSPSLFSYDPSPAGINASRHTTEEKIHQKLAELQAPLPAAPSQAEQISEIGHHTLQAPDPAVNVNETPSHPK